MPSTADLFAAIKQRWRMELAVFAAILVLVAIWTAITPKIYQASASLIFDDLIDPVEGSSQSGDMGAMLATQADVITSETLAGDVSRNLQLTPPTVVDQWRAATGGNGDVNIWRGAQLLAGLQVEPSRGSRVLSIKYKSADPDYSATIANAFASAYLDARLRQKTDPARTYQRWFEDRTREVRKRLVDAQAQLTAFQRSKGITDAGEANIEAGHLAELSGQLSGAEGAAASVNATRTNSLGSSQEVQQSGVVQGLRSSIAAKEAAVKQIASVYGPNHPDRIAAEAELAELRNKLNSEVAAASRAIVVASNAANARESSLRGLVDRQRNNVLNKAADRSQLQILQRDVDSAQASYDAVTSKVGMMRLQSEAPASNARLLDSATPPVFPSDPNVPLRIVLSTLLGGLLALSIGVGLELFRPRVRTPSGLMAKAGLPMIARIDFERSGIAPLLAARAAL